MKVEPVVLEGRVVRLEPLSAAHHDGIVAVAEHQKIWRFIPYVLRNEDDVRAYIAAAQGDPARLVFATIHRASGAVAGSTSFCNIDTAHRRLEIGGTWLAPAFQRTAVNSEAKYLMLSHCFETLGCIRVEFKTDSLNTASRAALTRLGAIEEGTFRNHMVMPDGRIRHSVYFSIVDSEWPAVKARLVDMMARHAQQPTVPPPVTVSSPAPRPEN